MKKRILLSAITLALSLPLCACEEANTPNNQPDISDKSDSMEISNLKSPVVNFKNTSNDNSINIVASWNKVEYADKYIISIDGNEVSTIDSLNETYSYVCPNISGEHTISVLALSNNENITSSKTEINYRILDTVSVKIDEATNIISWDKIDGASGYNIFVNDELVKTQTDTSYSLDFSKYSNNNISIVSYSDNNLSFGSCYSFRLDYTDLGYITRTIKNFDEYENTSSHVKVSSFDELIDAIEAAKYHYTSTITSVIGDDYIVRNNVEKNEANWTNALNAGLYLKESDGSYIQIPIDTPYPGKTNRTYYEKSTLLKAKYTQAPASGYTDDNFKGSVRIIEIVNDIDLGFNYLSSSYQAKKSFVESWADAQKEKYYTKTSMYAQSGISKIKIENTNDLLIMSRNGSKLTHGGFSIQSCDNVAFRNLSLDEMWQWEDSSSTSTSKLGDYDAYGWAYFKIGFCGSIWIDHCTFGKSFDGQIDISNPTYDTKGTVFRAPYGTSGESLVHISNCKFLSGSDDKDGYLYKMMEEIEADYQSSKKNNTLCNYQYYKALRDGGISFDDILYGIAIPQKKAFLDGDSSDEYSYNTNLRVSIGNCYFKNIEDRLPKLRSGVAYVYNSVFDNFEYYSYRTKLRNLNVSSLVSKVNSSWKCALVSQGIVCGNGGSVYSINCIYNGIETLLKNNDNTLINNLNNKEATANGGYKIINCRYQLTNDSEILTSNYPNATNLILNEKYFKWRDNDNNLPFVCKIISLDELKSTLISSSGAGNFNINWLEK